MIVTEKRTVPAHEETYLVKRVCGLCGAETHSWDEWPNRGNGREFGQASHLKIAIEQHDGWYYQGDGEDNQTIVDMCPACFHRKLLPWLKAQGVEPRKAKVEF